MSSGPAFIVVVILVSLDHSAGRLYLAKDLPNCEETQRLALTENKEIVCKPHCGGKGVVEDGRICLNLGVGEQKPIDASTGEEVEDELPLTRGNRVNINDPDTFAVNDDRYVIEKPLETRIQNCNSTGGDVRSCVARQIACHARDQHHCIMWRRAAYIFCSRKFCGKTYFKDCLLSHVLDDGKIVHTNDSHVSSGGWESFREHSVHYENSMELAMDLAKLDTGDDSLCMKEPAPAIPHCEWTMMLQNCPDTEDDEDHGDH